MVLKNLIGWKLRFCINDVCIVVKMLGKLLLFELNIENLIFILIFL